MYQSNEKVTKNSTRLTNIIHTRFTNENKLKNI